jgi:hypothetical protein
MTEYEQAIEHNMKGLTAVSTGVCPGCEECAQQYDYDDVECCENGFNMKLFDEAVSAGEVFDEGSFSWSGCDICGSSLGGTFEVWHAVDEESNEIVHGEHACMDCVMYLANGTLPEEG